MITCTQVTKNEALRDGTPRCAQGYVGYFHANIQLAYGGERDVYFKSPPMKTAQEARSFVPDWYKRAVSKEAVKRNQALRKLSPEKRERAMADPTILGLKSA